MATTLKYIKGSYYILRRVITYRNLLNVEHRIKVFPITAQGILEAIQ